ncbi:unnamed protein product [Musa textilis]
MPCSDDSLDCAACGCYRSFHRKVTGMDSSLCHLQNGSTRGRVPLLLPPPPTPHYHNLKLSRSSGIPLDAGISIGASVGAATESSSGELMAGPPPPQHQQHRFIVSRKRFRTKFTAEQQEGTARRWSNSAARLASAGKSAGRGGGAAAAP